MSRKPTISIIGAGNVAWHLAPALENIGYVVNEVYSRDIKKAKALVKNLYDAEAVNDLDFRESDSLIFIVAVSDKAIKKVVKNIKLPTGAILAHTSGSQPMEVLAYAGTSNIGVFYPLQTFSKHSKMNFSDIPICIEAEKKDVRKLLKSMGAQLSKKVYKTNSESRKALHVAAVFSCNFTNHLFSISEEIMNTNKLDFEMLKPLIVETVNKMLDAGARKSQTGPAVRGDFEIMDNHINFLNDNKKQAEIYQVMSQHIVDTYLEEDDD